MNGLNVFLERGDYMTKKMTISELQVVFVRFLRTILPQLPAITAYIVGIKPEWSALLALIGAILTALDKYLRDQKVY